MKEITDLKDTIVPSSEQTNSEDLLTGPITTTITKVTRGSAEQPLNLHIEGYRPYRPSKTCRRILIAAWGSDGHAWVGRSLTLFRDPTIKFAGVAVGGIMISHLSDIPERTTFMLATSRGKRKAYTVEPLHIAEYPQADFEKNLHAWRKAIDAGKITLEQLVAKVNAKGRLTAAQLAELRDEESWQKIMEDLKTATDLDEIERRMGKCAMDAETREELQAMVEAARNEKQ